MSAALRGLGLIVGLLVAAAGSSAAVEAEAAVATEAPPVEAEAAVATEAPPGEAEAAVATEAPPVEADAAVATEAPPVEADAAVATEAPPVDEAAPVAAAPPVEPAAGGGAFGLAGWKSDAPLSIESEQLDIEEEGGRRRLVFGGNVRASQGDLSLRAAHLVATYPTGGGQPERLEARGNVRLAQRDQKARCDGAVLDRVRDVLTCRGNAAFRDGDNCLAGDEIVIDLRKETVKVKGGATVLIEPEGEACGL